MHAHFPGERLQFFSTDRSKLPTALLRLFEQVWLLQCFRIAISQRLQPLRRQPGFARKQRAEYDAVAPEQRARDGFRPLFFCAGTFGLAGHVRMLANASALLQVLPRRLEAFMRSHPRIHVEVEERMSPQILGALLEGRADVGVVDMAMPSRGLAFFPFFRDQLALVLPAGHPLAGEREVRLPQMLGENFIVLAGANTVTTRLFNAAAAVGG